MTEHLEPQAMTRNQMIEEIHRLREIVQEQNDQIARLERLIARFQKEKA